MTVAETAALDATAAALARRVLADHPDDRAYGREAVAALPAPLAALVTARLDAAVADAAPSLRWLDADDDALRQATDAWRDAAYAAAHVPSFEWTPVVDGVAREALAHLVEPAEALADAAFHDASGPVTVETVLRRIGTFGAYPYLPEIAARYAERKGLDRLDRAGLATLLQRIDRRMAGSFGPDDWMTLLGPLFELAGPVGHPPGSVPTTLLRPLFRAKGADALADTLGAVDAVDAPTLRSLIAGVLTETETEPAPRPAPEPDVEAAPAAEVAPDVEAEPEVETAPTAPSVSAPEPAPRTLADRFAHSAPSEPSAEDGADDAAETASPTALDTEDRPDEGDAIDGLAPSPRTLAEQFAPESPSEAPVDTEAIDAAAPSPSAAALIGSRYGTPEFDGLDDSDVLGPPRPAEPDAHIADAAHGEAADDDPDEEEARFVDISDEEAAAMDETPADDPAPEPPPALDSTASSVAEPDTRVETEGDDEPLWKRHVRPSETSPEPSSPPAAEEVLATEHEDDEPLWKRFATSDLAERLPAPLPAPTPTPVEEFTAEPVAATLDSDSSPSDPDEGPASPELDALEATVLGPGARDRRDWYVSELFAGSPSAYHRTLGQIESVHTYGEVRPIFETEVFLKHRVSPYTDAAVAFIDAVQSQFEQRR